ncbi:LLM class flavin-dependent oxidoreductase [Agromyces seonyuensis]|uniref:LLM class flavin-dependent oxidoreductase n=1 Tax=Agromyces seonyuensis TaxID=2662446 RepID=A0A6I4NT22_9MICO|nr:LLM class flavin-dependent oxidoreductase [Agromyces seonyuensis]MWB97281.1 LLM class flavin-dependent oxidoreductase [Agromyces seonyuensis]
MTTGISIGLHGRTDAAVLRALAPRIEAAGFAGLWLNDVPGGDALAGLRAVAEVTETLRLGTGVIPLDRRPVDSLDLAGLPTARTTIGIGSGATARPVALVGDGIASLRERTDAAVVVGALGPRMRRLAAEHADGAVLNWLDPASASAQARELRRDAGALGRPGRSILYARTIAACEAQGALEAEASAYASFPAYAANFDRLGIRAIDATVAGPDALRAYLDADDAVEELVLRAITPTGSAEELTAFVMTTAEWFAR